MTILVADDDPVVRQLLEATVARWGYEPVVARDGAEAWAALEEAEGRISIAILDRQMPGMDGLEVCRRVRASPAGRYVYVILLTGHDKKEDIIAGLEGGADDYVTKPFHAEELRVRLQAGRRVVDLERALLDANERLRRQAMTDSLTGLLNHGAGITRLKEEVSRAGRHGTSLAVSMVDIDHFKRVNDAHGHAVGDRVLAHVARSVMDSVREHDVVCRYGGEEFLVILADAGLRAAVGVAERIRRTVAASTERAAGQDLHVTVSAGLALGDFSKQVLSGRELLRHADAALYQAKAEGRNRVAVADRAAPQSSSV